MLRKGPQLNPLSTNPTKWSNTLEQFVSNLLTNFLSVFDHFVKLALKGLKLPPFFEKLVNNRIVNHLEKCGLFSDFRHGRFYQSAVDSSDLIELLGFLAGLGTGATQSVALDIFFKKGLACWSLTKTYVLWNFMLGI